MGNLPQAFEAIERQYAHLAEDRNGSDILYDSQSKYLTGRELQFQLCHAHCNILLCQRHRHHYQVTVDICITAILESCEYGEVGKVCGHFQENDDAEFQEKTILYPTKLESEI